MWQPLPRTDLARHVDADNDIAAVVADALGFDRNVIEGALMFDCHQNAGGDGQLIAQTCRETGVGLAGRPQVNA